MLRETVPAYTSYRVPEYATEVTMVRALCKLAFVPVVADTDIVYPSSIRALKMGLKAVAREDAEDTAEADGWWARGIQLLDSERAEQDDGAIPSFRVGAGYALGHIPTLF